MTDLYYFAAAGGFKPTIQRNLNIKIKKRSPHYEKLQEHIFRIPR